MLKATYTYYKYIFNSREPDSSDAGDLQQVFYFPYCKYIVIEKEMAGILSMIKKDQGLLKKLKLNQLLRFMYIR